MERTRIKRLLLSFLFIVLFAASTYAQGNFVYVNNNLLTNSVSGFSVAANGVLTPLPGSPFPTGGTGSIGGFFASNRITATIVRNFLFVANEVSSSVAVFSINTATGALTMVPGSPFSTDVFQNNIGISLAATPDGRFLIVANGNTSSLVVFNIAVNGSLTQIPGAPFFAGEINPDGISISPDGRFLAVAFPFSHRVAMFTIANNGTLSLAPGGTFPAHGEITGLDINCASNLLFGGVATFGLPTVDVYNIAPNGSLTFVSGSPFFGTSGSNSNSALLSKDERFLFVSNQFSNSITVFSVAANGALAPIPGSPFPSGGGGFDTPLGMSTNRTGNLLFVASQTNGVFVFTIANNGALTPVPGAPFSAGPTNGLPAVVAFPPKTCGGVFDFCVQDDSSSSTLQFNTTTGEYLFSTCTGFTLGGTGTVTTRGGQTTLQHNASDRRVLVKLDTSTNKATASIQVLSSGVTFIINDRNITNNTCNCP